MDTTVNSHFKRYWEQEMNDLRADPVLGFKFAMHSVPGILKKVWLKLKMKEDDFRHKWDEHGFSFDLTKWKVHEKVSHHFSFTSCILTKCP